MSLTVEEILALPGLADMALRAGDPDPGRQRAQALPDGRLGIAGLQADDRAPEQPVVPAADAATVTPEVM